MITETIVAQCTPTGSGALALLRVSGSDAWAIACQAAKLSSKQKLFAVSSHTIHHGWVVDAQENKLDEVMFFAMRGPKTFTGENVIEITCHNNPFIIESVLLRIIECGARLAQPGEFSRQAVENNKLDLIQAEAINELIQANSQQTLKQSLEQLQGSFSGWVKGLEKNIIQLIALCEASFEFLEEEMNFSPQMKNTIDKTLAKITQLKKNFDQQIQLREGVRIALIGSVNAGKSSLFNALIGKKRAIVTSIAGTTRDSIEAGIYEDGTYLTLIDTAGLRNTQDLVESEGIKRAHSEAKMADIVLLAVDSSTNLTLEEETAYNEILNTYKEKIITVKTKSDLKQVSSKYINSILVSSQTNQNIQKLKDVLSTKIRMLFESGQSSFLLNKRHFTLLSQFEKHLLIIQAMLNKNQDYELIAHHLKEALATLTELTGKSVSEKALDAVFKEFCVGK